MFAGWLAVNIDGDSKSGLMKEKDFTPEQLAIVKALYQKAWDFPHLIDYEKTLDEARAIRE